MSDANRASDLADFGSAGHLWALMGYGRRHYPGTIGEAIYELQYRSILVRRFATMTPETEALCVLYALGLVDLHPAEGDGHYWFAGTERLHAIENSMAFADQFPGDPELSAMCRERLRCRLGLVEDDERPAG